VLLKSRGISLGTAVIAFLLFAPALLAHAKLTRSDPVAGARLDAAPRHITLVFTEKPEVALSSVRLIGPGQDTILLNSLRRDPGNELSLVADVPPGTAAGSYRVLWTAAGSDGHPSHGSIDFVVAPGQQANAPAPMSVDPVSEAETIAVAGAIGSILSRWLSFAACLVLVGVMTFRFLILPRMSPTGNDLFAHIASTNAATLGIVAAVGGLLAAMLKLARESSDMPDVPVASMMLDSVWGWSLLLQIVGVVAAGLTLFMVHRAGESKQKFWLTALGATFVLAVSPALSSHAGASSLAWLAVPIDMIHSIVGGMWLGTLAVVVIVGISAALKTPDALRPGARVADMINAFSPLALICGGAVVVTGIGSSLIEVPTLASLWTTPYGVVLLLKLFFVALLFAAGAWNWRRMKPRLTGDNEIAPLRSSASLELMLAVAVLAVTAILVALELP